MIIIKNITALLCTWLILMGGISLTLAAEADPFVLPQYSQKVNLDFKDANLKDVLRAFASQINANFIITSEVQDNPVTVFLEDIPVESAFDMILSAHNLTYEYHEDTNVFVIKVNTKSTDPVVTKIYRLKYASVSAAKINFAPATTSSTTISSSTSAGSSGQTSTGSSGEGSSSNGLVKVIASILTKAGTISEDARTNSLIVKDVQSNFEFIEQMVSRLDVPVAQISIEVEMLDVSKENVDKIGAKWGSDFFKATGAVRETMLPWDSENIYNKSPKHGDFSEDGIDLITTKGILDFSGATLLLQFLKSCSDTKSLARPRILTMDNQTSEIKISTDEAIGATRTVDTDGNQTITAERYETGVFLTVTPQSNASTNEVTLFVEPKVVEAGTGSTFYGVTFRDPEYRGVKSVLKVKSGDTVIIGGLLRTKNQDVSTKVPLLGDIPFLGRFFRHQAKDAKERELIIFLTPKILDGVNNMPVKATSFDMTSREQSSGKSLAITEEMNRLDRR